MSSIDWRQMKGEPALWYGRFHQYLLLGEERTIEDAWRQDRRSKTKQNEAKKRLAKRPGSSWYENAKKWNWQQRAAAYDRQQQEAERRAFARRRKEAKKSRCDLLDAAMVKVAQTMMYFDPSGAKPTELAQMLKVIMDQQRIEYDDMPTSKTDITTGGQPLGALTADILARLDREADDELDEFEKLFEPEHG